MQQILNIAHLIVALLLIVAILLQNRGAGVGGAFGGSSDIFYAKRGPEKILFNATIVLAALFLTLSIVQLVIS